MARDDPTVRMLYTQAQDAITARLHRLVPGSSSDHPPLLHDLLDAVCINLTQDDGQELTADDLVDALRIVPDQRARLELDERQLLEAALDRGETWESLAERLGWRSRQALQQRYRRLGGKRTWPTRRSAEAPWFGRLLRWERSPEGWRTRYAGREHEIIKLSREAASAWGGGAKSGWHFTAHPDDPDQEGPIGPGLGGTLDGARMLAEAWLITQAADRQSGAPNVLLALGDGGAAFGEHLAAYADHEQRRIVVYRFGQPEPVGTISPYFTVPARTDLESVGVAWTPALTGGRTLPAATTWREAAAAVAAAVATDTSEDR